MFIAAHLASLPDAQHPQPALLQSAHKQAFQFALRGMERRSCPIERDLSTIGSLLGYGTLGCIRRA